ncbi:uncharacterized protein V1516DRAFT_671892 [Lipomyces oligophaga]|uniref:uncharacterized protein n=1 Tax=Lipomyces oligophaga TaxID=45792 RepID=UPI0034CD0EE2
MIISNTVRSAVQEDIVVCGGTRQRATMASDPLDRLPPEVYEQVLAAVSFPAILALEGVNRRWERVVRDFVEHNPAAYTHLDFRNYDLDQVTPEVLLCCLYRGHGYTSTVLFPCHSTKNAHYSTLRTMIFLQETLSEKSYKQMSSLMIRQWWQLLAAESQIKAELEHLESDQDRSDEEDDDGYVDDSDERPRITVRYERRRRGSWDLGKAVSTVQSFHLAGLRTLAIDNLYYILRQWTESGIRNPGTLFGLTELHISAHALPMLFAFIRTRHRGPLFPVLRVLECWSDYDARRRLDVPHWLEIGPNGRDNVDDFVAFPELEEFIIGNGSISGRDREQDLDQDCLDVIGTWMPKLRVLRCRGVNIRPARYPRRREFVHRIDMRRSEKLVELDLSYTRTWIMPFVAPTCRRLILRGAGFGAVDLSNSVLTDGEQKEQCQEETLRLEIMRRSHGSLSPLPENLENSDEDLPSVSDMFRGLEELDLSNCGAVLTNTALLGILSLCSSSKLRKLQVQSCSQLEFGKDWSELMDQIVDRCQNLVELNVSRNSSVSDGDLVAIEELQWLEVLDLSGTSATDRGIKELVRGAGKRLRRVVLNACPDVTERMIAWVRSQGITTD